VIKGKAINCGSLTISAGGVLISDSTLHHLNADSSNASAVIQDSEIDGGTDELAATGFRNITLRRVDAHGGDHSVQCSGNCVVEDSWLHGQHLPDGASWHENGFISNGGSNVVLRHNTLSCDVPTNSAGGGCSGDASLFGDFAANSNYTIDGNLFVANRGASYCLYAGYDPGKPYGSNPTNIVVTNNVFQRGANGKCGQYGPVTSFKNGGSGNAWSNNRWEDGTAVTP
jgi:hypothetical protein